MDNLTELYCHIDDFYQAFKPQFERQLIENGTKRLRACKISVPSCKKLSCFNDLGKLLSRTQVNAGCIAHIGIADIQGQLISQKGRQRI